MHIHYIIFECKRQIQVGTSILIGSDCSLYKAQRLDSASCPFPSSAHINPLIYSPHKPALVYLPIAIVSCFQSLSSCTPVSLFIPTRVLLYPLYSILLSCSTSLFIWYTTFQARWVYSLLVPEFSISATTSAWNCLNKNGLTELHTPL